MRERSRGRWLSFSLKSLFLVVLIVATYFAGWKSALRIAEREKEATVKKAVEELRAQYGVEDLVVSISPNTISMGNIDVLATVGLVELGEDVELSLSWDGDEAPPQRSPQAQP